MVMQTRTYGLFDLGAFLSEGFSDGADELGVVGWDLLYPIRDVERVLL